MTDGFTPLTLEQLTELHRDPKRIPEQLTQLLITLTDHDEEVRAWAADCLQEAPQLDDQRAEQVAKYCNHENEVVANWACLTLAKAEHLIRFQEQLVTAVKQHSSLGVRQSAVKTLCELVAANSETLNALEDAAKSLDPRLQRLAKNALLKFSGRT